MKITGKLRPFVLGMILALAGVFAADVSFSKDELKVLEGVQNFSRAFEIIAAKVRPSVVNIRAESPGAPVSQGSGVIVDKRGFIITNSHVLNAASTILVQLTDGREFPAELVGQSPESDIAIIRIQAPDLTVAIMGDSDQCKVGGWILAIGNPFGLESSVTSGIISAKGRSNVVRLEIADFLQTDAPINPGNSGGPLVNLKGEVIGITAATNRYSEGLSFAIPINLARVIMNGIISHKRTASSYLGVVFRPITKDIANAFNLPTTRGALITKVIANSPAAKAGLQAGDIILKYGEREVRDDNQLRTFVATSSPGVDIPLEFYRKGKREVVNIQVAALPEEVIVARRSRKLLEDIGILRLVKLTDKLRTQLGYSKDAKGVLVAAVKKNSPAHSFLAPGSLILKVDGKEVDTPQQLHQVIGAATGCITISWRFGQFYGSRRIVCKN